ncbi:hypothetical protein OKW40_003722 [Paraburkholderia sp. RAU6.4a]
MNHPIGLPLDERGAVRGQHRHADESRQQRERIEQAEEAAVIGDAQIGIERERHALQQIAERDTEHQRRHEAADKEAPVPRVAPARILALAAIVEADRAEEQREQHEQHREVEA